MRGLQKLEREGIVKMDKRDFMMALGGGALTTVLPVTGSAGVPGEKAIVKLGTDILANRILKNRSGDMLKIMHEKLDEKLYGEIVSQVGRDCCKSYKMDEKAAKFRSNPEEFIKNIEKHTFWDEKATADWEKGVIKVTGKKRSSCVCPFAKSPGIPEPLCDHCCIGFQKELFESLLQTKVQVKVDESVLKGGNRCSHTIYFNVSHER